MSKKIIERFIGGMMSFEVDTDCPPMCKRCGVKINPEIARLEFNLERGTLDLQMWCSQKCCDGSDVIEGEVVFPMQMLKPANTESRTGKK